MLRGNAARIDVQGDRCRRHVEDAIEDAEIPALVKQDGFVAQVVVDFLDRHRSVFGANERSDNIFLDDIAAGIDRKSVVLGKSLSVRVDLGGRRTFKNKKTEKQY